MDPPWYAKYYDLFLRRAALLIQGNCAIVGVTLFPLLTRPSAPRERGQILQRALQYGFDLVALEPRATHYETPYFEQVALARDGLPTTDWRRGDLALFSCEGRGLPVNLAYDVEGHMWKEVLVWKIKVKVRIKPEEPAGIYVVPKILSHHRGKILPISRRDSLRGSIDLWTSTQVGLSIQGWEATWLVLKHIAMHSALPVLLKEAKDLFHIIRSGNLEGELQEIRTRLLKFLGHAFYDEQKGHCEEAIE